MKLGYYVKPGGFVKISVRRVLKRDVLQLSLGDHIRIPFVLLYRLLSAIDIDGAPWYRKYRTFFEA